MDDRRDLTFERIEEVMPEVERLMAGHATSRNWSLAQILHHLSTSIRLSLSPGPVARPAFLDPELERTFEIRRRRFFRSGRFPEGVEVPLEVLLPPVDADERVEAESLRAAIELLGSTDGPFVFHPLLGPMPKQEWLDFHRMHCAHHLRFATLTRP